MFESKWHDEAIWTSTAQDPRSPGFSQGKMVSNVFLLKQNWLTNSEVLFFLSFRKPGGWQSPSEPVDQKEDSHR
jgi:hypothetical protein